MSQTLGDPSERRQTVLVTRIDLRAAMSRAEHWWRRHGRRNRQQQDVRQDAWGTPGETHRAQRAARRPTADVTNLKTPKSSRYRLAAHGCKAPSTNAPNARPATSPSNGAPTAHDRVDALDQEETGSPGMSVGPMVRSGQ